MPVKPLFSAMTVCCGPHNAVAGRTQAGIAYKAISSLATHQNLLDTLLNRRTAP